MDLRQTPEYTKYMSSIGWIVSSIGRSACRTDRSTFSRETKTYAYIKRFPLIGSFIKIQRPNKIDYDCIYELIHRYKAFQIIIEPKHKNQVLSIKNHGYRQSKTPFVPAKTVHIDLTKSEKQLLKEMHYKTRYNIKKIQNSKFKIQNSKNIFSFADFWQESALKQRGMFLGQKKEIIELYKAFGGKAHLILASTPFHLGGVRSATSEVSIKTPRMVELKNKHNLLSGILMIQTKDIAYYMYAASSDKGKKLFAPTICVWESIKLAKKLGCKIYDFEGIYDERFPLKSWKGFTRFKKSFGGKEISYPGAFVKYRFPF